MAHIVTSAASDWENADLTAVVEGAPVAGVQQLAADGRRAVDPGMADC